MYRIVKTLAFSAFCLLLTVGFSACGSSSENKNDGDPTPAADIDPGIEVSDTDTTDQPQNVVKSIIFDIPEEAVNVAEFSGHFAFPDVIKLKNGRLMAVYRNGSTHADKSGAIIASFSDDGTVWDDPDILINDSSIDDRDPSIVLFSDGKIGINWFQYRYPDDYSEPWVHHILFATSSDNGASFSDPVQVDDGVFDYSGHSEMNEDGIWVDDNGDPVMLAATSSCMVEHDGKIIIPAYYGYALNWSNFAKTPKTKIVFYESPDSGRTWVRTPVNAGGADEIWLQEPALIKVDENRWILQVRSAKGSSPSSKGDLLQSVSTDAGKTWSDYRSLGFVAHAPELLKLENGVLISAFRWLDWEGSQAKREAVSMIYSLYNGETWSDLIEIQDCGAVECGYPGLAELDNNRFIVVYYTPGGKGIDSKIISFTTEE